jgi:hypothetical protein
MPQTPKCMVSKKILVWFDLSNNIYKDSELVELARREKCPDFRHQGLRTEKILS